MGDEILSDTEKLFQPCELVLQNKFGMILEETRKFFAENMQTYCSVNYSKNELSLLCSCRYLKVFSCIINIFTEIIFVALLSRSLSCLNFDLLQSLGPEFVNACFFNYYYK